MRTTTPFFHRQKSNVKRALEKITAKVASALRLAALDAAGPGSCGVTARQSRRGDQSGERAAPGDAAGLAVAVCIAVAVVVASRAQRNGAAADGAAVDPPALWEEQRAAISAKSEVAPGCRHRVSPTGWRTPALLSPQGGWSFSFWRGGVGCFIGAPLCPFVSAGTVAALCA